jgi:hypothetical protein
VAVFHNDIFLAHNFVLIILGCSWQAFCTQ